MANPWFRLYAEIVSDPKVIILSESLRWRYVALLCLHCDGKYENSPDDEIALALRITEKEWQDTKEVFIFRKLLNTNGSLWGWDKRQYISDIKDPTAASRQQRYRDKKREERNSTVTSRSSEADTDTDKPKPPVRSSTSRFSEFWDIWPRTQRRVGKTKCQQKWKSRKLDEIADQIIAHVQAMKKTKKWIDGFEPSPERYINGSLWNDEVIQNSDCKSTKTIGVTTQTDDKQLINLANLYKISTQGVSKPALVSKINSAMGVS